MTRDLSGVSTPQLVQLHRLVRTGDLSCPLTEAGLLHRGLGMLWRDISWMAALDASALGAVLRVALAERERRQATGPELVWTGPEPKVSTARDTAVVVRQLFGRAQRSVLVTGFRVDGGKSIFEPLCDAIRDRGVDARVFLHLDDRPGMSAKEAAEAGVAEFLRTSWPEGGPVPAVFYDPRTVAPGSSINLHAKCVVVDGRYSLIGSANFTHNAHVRSIEVGVVVDDVQLATDLTRQWQGLIDNGLIAMAPNRSGS